MRSTAEYIYSTLFEEGVNSDVTIVALGECVCMCVVCVCVCASVCVVCVCVGACVCVSVR